MIGETIGERHDGSHASRFLGGRSVTEMIHAGECICTGVAPAKNTQALPRRDIMLRLRRDYTFTCSIIHVDAHTYIDRTTRRVCLSVLGVNVPLHRVELQYLFVRLLHLVHAISCRASVAFSARMYVSPTTEKDCIILLGRSLLCIRKPSETHESCNIL